MSKTSFTKFRLYTLKEQSAQASKRLEMVICLLRGVILWTTVSIRIRPDVCTLLFAKIYQRSSNHVIVPPWGLSDKGNGCEMIKQNFKIFVTNNLFKM